MFKNLSIKSKMVIGLGLIIGVMAISTLNTTKSLHTIQERSEQTALESVPFAISAANAKFATCQIQQFVTDSSLTHDDGTMQEAISSYNILMSEMDKFEKMYKAENDTKGLADVKAIRDAAVELLDTGKRMALAYTHGVEAGNVVMEEFDGDSELLATKIDALKESQNNEAIANSMSAMNESTSALMYAIIFGVATLLIGIVVGVSLTSMITSSLNKFQVGLFSFFAYLNRESKVVKPIDIKSEDEFGQMAKVVNTNILKTQKGIEEDRALIDETIKILGEFESGDLCQRLDIEVANPALMELKAVLNQMASNLEGNIDNVLAVLEQYAQYNYLKKIDSKGLKEHLLKLANGVNTLGDAVTGMLVENKSNGLALDDGSDILLESVDKLNVSSTQVAASLEETAASLEEMTSNIRSTTENIGKMASYASSVTSSATQGESLANQTTVAMEDIDNQVNAINDAIAVIDQIAFQTNILSLNAAVEAATAGEAGKGFAVVAGEVRNLANRSAEAARSIKTLVEHATLKANEGKEIANNMIQGYNQLNQNISQTITLIGDIEAASKEQLKSIEHINGSISDIDQQMQANASVAGDAHSVAVLTDKIAKLVVDEANAKEFVGKDNVKAKIL